GFLPVGPSLRLTVCDTAAADQHSRVVVWPELCAADALRRRQALTAGRSPGGRRVRAASGPPDKEASMPESRQTGTSDGAAAVALRSQLVEQLRASGAVRTERVGDAVRAVARHVFVPGVALEAAYANDAVVTKRDGRGVALSSVSAPRLVAMMLEQLRVQPGHRVLEIGSGGYNAALLAELVGPAGSVTTVDI